MQDTLQYVAQSNTMQEVAVIVQGILLIVGAIINLFPRKRY